MSRQKQNLLRIVVSAVFFAAAIMTFNLMPSPWFIELIGYGVIYLFIGYDIIIKGMKGVVRGRVLDENLLMVIASVGALCVGEYPEAVLVMWLYQIGELFQSYAVGKSRKSIASLMDIRPDSARLFKDGAETVVPPEEVAVGDLIAVLPGEKIPLDGVVERGAGSLNTAALTGEAVPVSVKAGDRVLSGSINLDNALILKTEKTYYDSTVSKILELVENAASKKAKAENFITKFARIYTPAVVIAALFLAIIPSLVTGEWSVWIYRSLSFLVASCPCALVISVPLSFFAGLGGASKEGVLIKGGNYLELLSKADTFVFDKTGTITQGNFEVQGVSDDSQRARILSLAAIAESRSTHPIAQSILRKAEAEALFDRTKAEGWQIEEIAGHGLKAVLNDAVILAGNDKLMKMFGIEFEETDASGTMVYVAENGKFIGAVMIADTVKEDSFDAIEQLKNLGCTTHMLTGDNRSSAEAVAKKVGLTSFDCSLLPKDKVEKVERMLEEKSGKGKLAFVGDGINDAPVLMRADIGIAMGGIGSDSAIEAADVVLMHDTLTSIPKAQAVAKKTMRIVVQNIVFAIAVKAAVLVLSALGITDMWLAIFADVGVTVIAVVNAMRAVKAPKMKIKGITLRENRHTIKEDKKLMENKEINRGENVDN